MEQRRGLRLLLPRALPPSVVAHVSAFAGWECAVGHMVRLSLRGTLQDAYTVDEDAASLVLLLRTGGQLRVPRGTVGQTWAPDTDTNPRSLASLSPEWLTLVLTGPKMGDPVADFELHVPPAEERREAFPAGTDVGLFPVEGSLGQRGSTHRRLRLFVEGEDLRHPCRPPVFIYAKLALPYLRLLAPHPAEGYMREAAAYTILPDCTPAVAPVCHHASQHPDGSYALLLEDLAAWSPYRGTVRSTLQERRTGNTVVRTADPLPKAKRVVSALAVLHGQFLTPAAGCGTPEDIGGSAQRRRLRSAMVHEHVFYAQWAGALNEATDICARRHLAALYGAAVPEPETEEELDLVRRGPDLPGRRSRLTLVHGRVCTDHVLLAPDRRMSPDCLLLDWKAAGIGPLEVDLVHLFATLPVQERTALLPPLLVEYRTALRVFFGVVDLSVADLVVAMRDAALLLVASGAFDWNCEGEWQRQLTVAHTQLAAMSAPLPLAELREAYP